MELTRLGRTGLKVSRLCLGCMSYGDAARGHHAWVLDEERSRPFLRRALELGINFFDSANMYSGGASEEILGRAIRDFARREEVVLATKVYFPMGQHANAGGLSRKAILREVDASLRRLGTDYIDLYQIHRWDPETPIEETLQALHDVVRAGKVLYLGASTMATRQFVRAQYLADRHGWTRFVSMQPHYNLLERHEERDMLPFCREEGVGVIPWSPLARGLLARPWSAGATARTESDQVSVKLYGGREDRHRGTVDRLEELSRRRGQPMAQLALAWLLAQPGVSAPIVGATRLEHLEDAVAALQVRLDEQELVWLGEPSELEPLAT